MSFYVKNWTINRQLSKDEKKRIFRHGKVVKRSRECLQTGTDFCILARRPHRVHLPSHSMMKSDLSNLQSNAMAPVFLETTRDHKSHDREIRATKLLGNPKLNPAVSGPLRQILMAPKSELKPFLRLLDLTEAKPVIFERYMQLTEAVCGDNEEQIPLVRSVKFLQYESPRATTSGTSSSRISKRMSSSATRPAKPRCCQ